MISLYHFPISQHSRRVVSLLEEANLPYQAVLVDMTKGGHMSDDYLSINPNHQVPSLVDDEVSLYESHAIMRYLCDKHNLETWYPKNIVVRAQVDQWLDWCQCQFGPEVKKIVFNMLFAAHAGLESDKQAIESGQQNLKTVAAVLENHLTKQDFLAADHATIADLALASNIYHLGLADQAPRSPAIQAWYDRIASLKGFQKSLPEM